MSDHEQLADQAEAEADAMEQESERIARQVEEAKKVREEMDQESVMGRPKQERAGED